MPKNSKVLTDKQLLNLSSHFLEEWMDYFGINSQKLHELSGVSTSILSSVLNGRYGLSVTTAQKIAKALNIDINFLYTHPHKTSQPKSNPPQSDKIPVIGYAGMGETLYMLGPYDDPVFLTPPIPFPGDFEVVIMNGHYLEPSIVKDSVLLFHAKPTDLALEEIKPSHFYLCGLHDGRELTCSTPAGQHSKISN